MKDRAYKMALKSKYNRYQRGLASMVYKIFDEKIGSGVIVDEVQAPELQKIFKRRKMFKI